MHKLLLLLLAISVSAHAAGEDCIFDTGAQMRFIKQYVTKHPGSTLVNNGLNILIKRNNEIISFSRGGCVHFGIDLDVTIKHQAPFTEEQLFTRILAYNEEFGTELVTTKELAHALQNKYYKKMIIKKNTLYFVKIPSVASYEISYQAKDNDINISIGFYIN